MSLPRRVLEKYITRGCLFIEVGARWGDSCIRAIEAGASAAGSCETDPLMATIAQMHCDDLTGEKVNVECCDSVTYLGYRGYEKSPHHESDVVFLDAHTATSSPVLQELDAIRTWKSKPRHILIDDLRCMYGWGINAGEVRAKLEEMGYRISFEDGVEPNDIMVGTLS